MHPCAGCDSFNDDFDDINVRLEGAIKEFARLMEKGYDGYDGSYEYAYTSGLNEGYEAGLSKAIEMLIPIYTQHFGTLV